MALKKLAQNTAINTKTKNDMCQVIHSDDKVYRFNSIKYLRKMQTTKILLIF